LDVPVSERPILTRDDGGARQHLKVEVHGAQHLIAKDLNGYSDPYALFDLAGQRARTRVVSSSCNPTWEQTLYLELPKILDPVSDVLKINVLDYDGPLINPEFLGKTEINVAEVWRTSNEGESFSRMWLKLHGKKTSRRNDRGSICISLSFVDDWEYKQASEPKRDAIVKAMSRLEDVNLNEWKLRVTIHEGRGFDVSGKLKRPRDSGQDNPFMHRIAVRLGSCLHTTNYKSVSALYPSEDAAEAPEKYGRCIWNETFDFPLKEATKTLKLDARITNHLIRVGNNIGLDGIFYDTREDMTNTEDVRFIVSKALKEDVAVNDGCERTYIEGIAQFPLSGIYGFSDPGLQPEAPKTKTPTGDGSLPKPSPRRSRSCESLVESLSQGLPGDSPAEASLADSGTSRPASGGIWSSYLQRRSARGNEGTFSRALKSIMSRMPLAPSASIDALSDAGTQATDAECESEAPPPNPQPPSHAASAQQTWITVDGRGGAYIGEILVSFLFIQDVGAESCGCIPCEEALPLVANFDAWLGGITGDAEDELNARPMELPIPLKDGLFADAELDTSLPNLFYLLVNQESEPNRQRMGDMREFASDAWVDVEGGMKRQRSSYILKLPPNRLGPNEAYSEVDTTVELLSPSGFVIREVTHTPKISFGDAFYTETQIAAAPIGPGRCRLQMSFSIEFTRGCIFKSTIQKATIQGARAESEKRIAALKKALGGGAEGDAGSVASQPLAPSKLREHAVLGEMAAHALLPAIAFAALTVLVLGVLLFGMQRTNHLQVQLQREQADALKRLADALERLGRLQGCGDGAHWDAGR